MGTGGLEAQCQCYDRHERHREGKGHASNQQITTPQKPFSDQ
jgi:hypothetical protein